MGETAKAPQAPKFSPINIPDAMAQALSYDVAGWDFSDSDWLARFPGLVAQRDSQITDAYNQLTGPLDSTVESSFTKTGLNAGATAFGGGDPLSGLGMTQGSAGRNAASVSLANNLLEKQNYDRQVFSQLLADNPQRQFGLGASDVSSLFAVNSGGVNQANQQAYQAQLTGIYGAGAQNAQTGAQIAALGNIIASLNNRGYGGYG